MGICSKWSRRGIYNVCESSLFLALMEEEKLTMESLAPLSPRKYIGWLSLIPSYTTPLGNMDWDVIPKMKTRKVK
jgi:hypothetical protein